MSEDYRKYVLIAVPGDTDGQGGIIRQMDYLRAVWPEESDWKLEWLPTWNYRGCKPCRFVWSLAKMVWRRYGGRADVLHLNLASQGSFYRKFIMAKMARFMRLPFVVHLHGGGFQTFYDTAPAIVQRRIEWMFYYAHHCVVLGRDGEHFLELRFRMPHEKITVCQNAVPDTKLRHKPNAVAHIVFVGQVLPRKGMDDLVEALAALKAESWRASIIGSGQVSHYRDQVVEKGLQAKVRFIGWQGAEAIDAHYSEADILVLPSYVENQPLTIIEAMARGVAIIATRVGTIPEMIEHGKTGLLIEAGNVEQLQAAIKVLIEDPEARQKLAKAARKDYEERFTLERYVRQWQAIYQDVLSF